MRLLAPVLCAMHLVTLLMPLSPLGVAEAHLPFAELERLRFYNLRADSWAGGSEEEDFSLDSPFDILAMSVDCEGRPRPRDSIAVAALLSTPDDVDWYLRNKTTSDAEVGRGMRRSRGGRELMPARVSPASRPPRRQGLASPTSPHPPCIRILRNSLAT
jgi:hypothetical protein